MAPRSVRLPPNRAPGRLERLYLERIERDHASAKERGLWFDEDEARFAVEFFSRYCRHSKGEWAGKPLELTPDQARLVRELYGWRRESGVRRFTRLWLEVARKNGKTTLAAGLGAKELVASGEAGGEVYFCATKREQAMIAHVACAQMIRQSPELLRFVKVPKGYLRGATLVCERLGSKAEPISADHNTLDGLSPSCLVRDEIHAWKDHGLAAVLDTAMGARRQPISIEATTAGVFDQDGVGWTHHDYATKVLEGAFSDDTLLAYICAADPEDDPFDPATWWKANPNLGVSPKLEYIAEQAERAKRQPSTYNDFLRLHLNLWTQQTTRWLSVERWRDNDGAPLDVEQLQGRACWGGLDLSSTLDLTAFVLAFPSADGGVTLLPRFWLPEAVIEREARKGRRHYETWAREGWLIATPGDTIDYRIVRQEIRELGERFRIQEIAFDEWNSSQFAHELADDDGFKMVPCRQGFKTLSEPSKAFEALVVSRKIRHGGHPVLAWCVSNAVVATDPAGNIKPDKSKASDKIDGVVAAIMALSRANLGEESTGSYLDQQEGVLII